MTDRELKEQQQHESDLVRSVQNAARDVTEATQRFHNAVIEARLSGLPLRHIGQAAGMSHTFIANICRDVEQ